MTKKIDRVFDYISLMLIAGGGMLLHTLTSLTIKTYYGDPWGYVSFLLPGLSEVYLASIQLLLRRLRLPAEREVPYARKAA